MNRKLITVINLSALTISIFIILFFCKVADVGMGKNMSWVEVLMPLWLPIFGTLITYLIFIIFKRNRKDD